MALVRTIVRDALIEIGVSDPLETPTAEQAALGLRRFQNQLDAWAADQLTLSRQLRTVYPWPSNTVSQTIGATGNIAIVRPMFLNGVNYIIPGTDPSVEVPLGPMDQDSYMGQRIKELASALPLQFFYQTALDGVLGTIALWPVPTQDIDLVFYSPQAVNITVSLDTDVTGPSGYAEAFMYQLALRLCNPFGVQPPPLLPKLAAQAFATMKRPNVDPGLLGTDQALVPNTGGAYNILSDSSSGSRA